MKSIHTDIKKVFAWLVRHGKHTLDTLREAFNQFQETRAAQAAAALSYYAFFSLFPLILFLVSVTSSVLKEEQAYQRILEFVQPALPLSVDLLEANITRVLELRGTVGFIAIAGLLWSALSVFDILGHNINLAWQRATQRTFLKRRLVALGMVGGLIILWLLSLFSTAVATLLPELEFPIGEGISLYDTYLWTLLGWALPWLFSFGMFLALFHWAPNTHVTSRAGLAGAFFSAVAWELGKKAFAWYLSSGFVRYELVYGSLGAVVSLLLWIYLSGVIILFGAHLTATLDRRQQRDTAS